MCAMQFSPWSTAPPRTSKMLGSGNERKSSTILLCLRLRCEDVCDGSFGDLSAVRQAIGVERRVRFTVENSFGAKPLGIGPTKAGEGRAFIVPSSSGAKGLAASAGRAPKDDRPT